MQSLLYGHLGRLLRATGRHKAVAGLAAATLIAVVASFLLLTDDGPEGRAFGYTSNSGSRDITVYLVSGGEKAAAVTLEDENAEEVRIRIRESNKNSENSLPVGRRQAVVLHLTHEVGKRKVMNFDGTLVPRLSVTPPT